MADDQSMEDVTNPLGIFWYLNVPALSSLTVTRHPSDQFRAGAWNSETFLAMLSRSSFSLDLLYISGILISYPDLHAVLEKSSNLTHVTVHQKNADNSELDLIPSLIRDLVVPDDNLEWENPLFDFLQLKNLVYLDLLFLGKAYNDSTIDSISLLVRSRKSNQSIEGRTERLKAFNLSAIGEMVNVSEEGMARFENILKGRL
ncbi:hypothetical protein D9758_010686 [Tetrapyrgos nigripes]|uniref:Uncharacterized protein n=1 Tax=Tetrapyrgos nigripes TaxID=182062 RepID=A0A8H5GGL1_9AGAR|nr:hypothetical protein D9758_010686 [Tetrapyrgos nigripes]